jgi:hypothetical protein
MLHEHDVLGEGLFQIFSHHGVAAVFDHHRFLVETTDIRECFDQNIRFFYHTPPLENTGESRGRINPPVPAG